MIRLHIVRIDANSKVASEFVVQTRTRTEAKFRLSSCKVISCRLFDDSQAEFYVRSDCTTIRGRNPESAHELMLKAIICAVLRDESLTREVDMRGCAGAVDKGRIK